MVKINEVASAAGVSISTVSYALSGKRPVSEATRRRIETAVRELGYSPNAGARMLAGDRTHIFALTEPFRRDTHAPTHMAFVLATAIAARQNGYDVLLLTDEEAQAGMRRVAASGLVDAILVLDVAPDDPRVELARQIATPTVFIGIPDDHEGLVCVDLDFEAAGALAVDRLVEAGHRNIGLLGQPDVAYEKSNFPPRVRRAVVERAAERGARVVFRSAGDVDAGAAAIATRVDGLLDEGVTALLLHATDVVHALALERLRDRGIAVPGDLSVVSVAASFDVSGLPQAVDVIPLVPEASCALAVDLAMRALTTEPPASGLHLLPPAYVSHGTVGTSRA